MHWYFCSRRWRDIHHTSATTTTSRACHVHYKMMRAFYTNQPHILSTHAVHTLSTHLLYTHKAFTHPGHSLKLQLTRRLLEEAASSCNSTALLLPSTALMGRQGHTHTRVLRVAPVSSVIGPPSFPTSSAALEEESESQPLIVTQAARAPQPLGGLSRSLSASASSSSGLMPSATPAGGITQSGDITVYQSGLRISQWIRLSR